MRLLLAHLYASSQPFSTALVGNQCEMFLLAMTNAHTSEPGLLLIFSHRVHIRSLYTFPIALIFLKYRAVTCLTGYLATTRSDFIYCIFVYEFIICLDVIIHSFLGKVFSFRHITKSLCTISRSPLEQNRIRGILLKFCIHLHFSVSYLVLKSHPFSVTA